MEAALARKRCINLPVIKSTIVFTSRQTKNSPALKRQESYFLPTGSDYPRRDNTCDGFWLAIDNTEIPACERIWAFVN